MKYVDCHCHTNNSFDADNTPAQMIYRAEQLGLYAVCITDHCEFYLPDTVPEVLDDNEGIFADPILRIKKSFAEISEVNSDKVKVLKGVESGQPSQDIKRAYELAGQNFDFILGSLHNNAGERDFYFTDFSNMPLNDIEGMLERYYTELVTIAELGCCDSIGHITYPLRYITGRYGIDIDLEQYYPLIDRLFEKVIESEKGIEINTSGLRDKINSTLPGKDLLKRYRKAGGEIITIGSDAHNTRDLGRGIKEGYRILAECGFRYVCYFENRAPRFIKIV